MTLTTPGDSREARAASGSTSLPLGARDEAWDAGAAVKSMDDAADLAKYHFWRDPNGDPAVKSSYKLPFGMDGHAVWRGVTAAAQRLGMAQIPDADLAGVRSRIAAYYRKAAQKYNDDSIVPPWEGSASEPDAEMRFAVAPVTHVDVRDPSGNDDNTWTMSGYAAVFNQQTTLYDGKFIRVTESIDHRAFNGVLGSQPMSDPDGVVHFNLGHDMNRAVAATDVPAGQPGSLQLRADAHGLAFLAKVPRDDPDGVAMAAKMRSGVLRQASFAFTVAKDEITTTEQEDGPDVDHRSILEVKRLYDVCATPQGAYPQTVAGLRSYAAAIGQPIPFPGVGGQQRQPDTGGATDVSPGWGGVADLEARRMLKELQRAKARYTKR